jgi:hypothetical protein
VVAGAVALDPAKIASITARGQTNFDPNRSPGGIVPFRAAFKTAALDRPNFRDRSAVV